MNVFIDTEFSGLTKDTELISLGCISDDGRTFYGEITDFNHSKCDEWIKTHIFPNLISKGKDGAKPYVDRYKIIDKKENVMKAFIKYLNEISVAKYEDYLPGSVQFVSDCLSYDQVLINDLLLNGRAADKLQSYFPKISPAWYDINHLIAEKLNMTVGQAFDITREDLVIDEMNKFIKFNNDFDNNAKHNSLFDAYVIKLIYDKCNETRTLNLGL